MGGAKNPECESVRDFTFSRFTLHFSRKFAFGIFGKYSPSDGSHTFRRVIFMAIYIDALDFEGLLYGLYIDKYVLVRYNTSKDFRYKDDTL